MAPNPGRSKTAWARKNGKVAAPRRNTKVNLHGGEDVDLKKSALHFEVNIEVQQLVLDIFKTFFANHSNDELSATTQRLKQHLFHRRFAEAFGAADLLEAYMLRWSPSRALAYAELFSSVPRLSDLLICTTTNRLLCLGSLKEQLSNGAPFEAGDGSTSSAHTNIACLGGGAGAEVIALAACRHALRVTERGIHLLSEDNESLVDVISHEETWAQGLRIKVVDKADWSEALKHLHHGIVTTPTLSGHALASVKQSQQPLQHREDFKVEFLKDDLLDMELEYLSTMLQNVSLVTLMFTLNELYTISISKSTNLLLTLTYLLKPGSLLLVVDSPGSYSTIAVDQDANNNSPDPRKKYPMQWLLDHTLLEASSVSCSKNAALEVQWKKLMSDDSRWFRLPTGLQYPIDLEDMRYQIHLYERV